MTHDLFTTLFLILVGLFIIDISIRIYNIIVSKQQQKQDITANRKNSTDKVFENSYLKKPIYDNEGTWQLYVGMIEQMGATYNVQFGTALSSIIKRTDNKSIDGGVIDICITDPRSLKVVAVIMISQSGIYSTTSKQERNIIELLNLVHTPVLTLKKQDFYSVSNVCTQVMDTIDMASSLNHDKNKGNNTFY